MLFTKSRFGALAAPVAFTDNAGAPIPNTGLAFVLPGGSAGLALTHLHVGRALQGDNTLDLVTLRLIVAKGSLPNNIATLQSSFEPNTQSAFPAASTESGELDILYHATYETNAGAPDHCDFPDWTGPRVGPGETMLIMLFPTWTTEAAAVPFAVDQSLYLQMNAFGKYLGENDTLFGRAVPRGRIG